MSQQFYGSTYLITTYMRKNVILFWIILLAFFFITGVAGLLIGGKNVTVSFDFSIPIYIFGAIVGFVIVKNCVPYLIKMGSTRTNVFLSFGAAFLGISLLNSILANTINLLSEKVLGLIKSGVFVIYTGDEEISFTHIAELISEDTLLNRVIIDLSISFFLISCMFLLGLIFFRFGPVGGFLSLGAFFIIFLLSISNGWLEKVFVNLFTQFEFSFFYKTFLAGLFIYALSFLLFRRIKI